MDFKKFSGITTFIFDVDGVFTDNTVLVTEKGELLRRMYVKDGQAIHFAMNAGYRVAIITKGNSKGVRTRLEVLGIPDIFDAVKDKKTTYETYKADHGLKTSEILYMGDDLPDIAVLKAVGLSCCPSDAESEVINVVDYVSPKRGGWGCVRDVIEKVMRIQDKWLL